MPTILAIAILGLSTMLQIGVVSRVPLLQGTADLMLLAMVSWGMHPRTRQLGWWALSGGLFIGWISALPIWLPPLSYALVMAVAAYLRRRVWQIPLLALLTTVFVGTFITNLISFGLLRVLGTPLDLIETLNLIVLPSLLLNLLLAIPVNSLVGEAARWLYPTEFEV